jgi:hypothetical protein
LAIAAGGEEPRVITQIVTRTVTLPPPERGSNQGTRPAISRAPLRRGEVLVTGDTAPKSFGPYDFEPGLYTFRFEQFAPELPGLDFATEASSITVSLDRQPRVTAPDSVLLVNSSQRTGDNQASLSGKYYVDVNSADHSYVLRFTPRG